ADKDFDGEPVQIYEPKPGDPMEPPEVNDTDQTDTLPGQPEPAEAGLDPLGPFAPDGAEAPKKYVVGGLVTVAVARERVQYLNAEGKLITESLRDYTRINLAKRFDSLDQFLQAWSDAERKAALIAELESQGVLIEALAEEVGLDLDPFDLLLHVAYNMPMLTRRERASRVKKRNVFTQYGTVARKVLDALLDKYADEGIATLESNDVLKVQPFTHLGSPVELINSFGGRAHYLGAIQTLERELYTADA
ncbi:MAG: type I restriction-modification enzyme R subunit C-terminal domain-containing protein, partial [Rhodoferax sp.]|nr:type I restriction-modification enzyme R subunit C-terminal domain-containing protein [Rhodoferax sp.]